MQITKYRNGTQGVELGTQGVANSTPTIYGITH